MKPKNKLAIVTGASSGIGQGSVVALAAEGANMVITGRDANALARSDYVTGIKLVVDGGWSSP